MRQFNKIGFVPIFLLITVALLFISGCWGINFSSTGSGIPSLQTWAKCLGGTNGDFASSICQTADGGYITAGESDSNDDDVSGNHGNGDFWVVKTDNEGTIQWQKCLGGSSNDEAKSIQQTADGGYIVAGYTLSNDGDVSGNHGDPDYWVVKLDDEGTIQWQKCLGGTYDDRAYEIKQTTDGGYIVTGYTRSNDGDVSGNHGNLTFDYWVVKLDDEGTIQWQKCLGGSNYDWGYSIQQTADEGYIVTGQTDSNDGDISGYHGNSDKWVVKLDDEGNIEWQKCLGGTLVDYASSVRQTADGGYITAGFTFSNNGDVSGSHGGGDYWVVKLDDEGNIEWQKCLGGTQYDLAESINLTADGGYIVAGRTDSNDDDVSGNHGRSDYWIIKINDNGVIQWQKCLGGSQLEYAYSIQQTLDSGYIVAGQTGSNDGDVSGNHGVVDYWVVKLDSNGEI